jgi:rhodanese-related sulfurtransferase
MMQKVFLITLWLASAVAFAMNPAKLQEIEAARAAREAVVVDIRELDEQAVSGVWKGSVLLPTSEIKLGTKRYQEFLQSLERSKPVYVYCASGGRAGRWVADLKRAGYQAVNIGGFEELRQAGAPVSKINQ